MFGPMLISVVEAVMMLFIFRSLLESSHADYYHPITQGVIKLTNFAVKLPAIKNFKIKQFNFAGIFIAFIIGLVFWAVFAGLNYMGLKSILLLSVLMLIKVFGYLILVLLLVQALCSWLEATRAFSYYLSQITSIIVAPVQRIIPTIGMIDLSLMVVMLAIFFINRLFASFFGYLWLIL